MARLSLLRTDNFTGGLNLRADPFQLGADESPDLLNVDLDPRGGFSSRGGWTRLNTSAIGGIAAGSFAPDRVFAWDGPTPQLLVAANNKVFFATNTSFTDTTIASTSTHGACFAQWSGSTRVVYMSCGTGSQGVKWDGSARTLLTASGAAQWQESYATPTGTHMPKAEHAAVHVDRLWVANTAEDAGSFPDRVRWSHPLFPESWRSADYIDIVGGGVGITAIVPFGGALYVFKRRSIWAIYGYDETTFQVVEVTSKLGAATHHAVVATEGMLLFFSWPDGLFSYDGRQFRDMFVPLRPLIDGGLVNQAVMDQVHLSVANRRVWLSLPQGNDATPTYNYVLDLSLGRDGSWTRFQGADGRGLASGVDFVTSTNQRYSVFAHPTQPYLIRVDIPSSAQDDLTGTPTNFASYYMTRWVDAGTVSQRKMWRRPDMVVKQPSVTTVLTVAVLHDWQESPVKRTFQVTVDGTSAGLLWAATAVEPDANAGWGQANWGSSAEGSVLERGSSIGLARSVQLQVSGPGGKPWGVNSITYKFNPRKVRG